MPRVRVCPYCRHQNPPTARFCGNAACGQAIDEFEIVDVASPDETTRPRPAAGGVTVRAELRCVADRDLSFQLGDNSIVGRGADVDVTPAPDSRFISRRHARFYWADGSWHVEVLSTTNPTTVGGVALTGSRRLVSGETVVLGRAAFVFKVLA